MSWVTTSTLRLANRSATSPAAGDISSIGRNCSPVTMPSAVAELSVSFRTIQSWATRCIQVPTLEMTAPPA
jgi:hypothetical protein